MIQTVILLESPLENSDNGTNERDVGLVESPQNPFIDFPNPFLRSTEVPVPLPKPTEIAEPTNTQNQTSRSFNDPEARDSILENRIVELLEVIRGISVDDSEPSTSATPTTNSNVCCVCLDDPRDSAFMTCGHYCICKNCADKFRERKELTCPVCRRKNVEIRTFFDC